jgi:sec-independent protein translocase protein TatA
MLSSPAREENHAKTAQALSAIQRSAREPAMPFQFGATELIILLVIVIVLFGVGRIARIGGEIGRGIRAFREGLGSAGEKTPENDTHKIRIQRGTSDHR